MKKAHLQEDWLKKWRARRRAGQPLLGAMCAQAGEAAALSAAGADFLVAVHLGAFAGHEHRFLLGLTATGDANTVLARQRRQIVEAAPQVAVFSGVFVGDPFVNVGDLLARCAADGVAGIQNYPTTGLFREDAPAITYEQRLGYDAEVAAMEAAGGHGLLRAPLASTPADAGLMAAAGCEVLVTLATAGGDLPVLVEQLRSMVEGARSARPDVLVLAASARALTAAQARDVLAALPDAAGFFSVAPAEGGEGRGALAVLRGLRGPGV